MGRLLQIVYAVNHWTWIGTWLHLWARFIYIVHLTSISQEHYSTETTRQDTQLIVYFPKFVQNISVVIWVLSSLDYNVSVFTLFPCVLSFNTIL